MVNKNIPTGYANSKSRVIFTSASGKPYVRTAEGKKSYAPKAAFAMNNGSTRKLTKANVNKVPTSIRPKRIVKRSTPKKNAFASVKKAASPSKTVRKTVSPNKKKSYYNRERMADSKMNTRRYLINRGFTKKAAARVAPRVNAGYPSYRYSKTTGMRRNQGGRGAFKGAYRQGYGSNGDHNRQQKRRVAKAKAAANKAAANKEKAAAAQRATAAAARRKIVNSNLRRGQQFSKMMNKLVARKKKPAAKKTLVKRASNTIRRTATKGVSNSLKMGQQFAKMMNKLVARKPRKPRANKGKPRALVASPGGRLYKGRAAMKLKKNKAEIKKNATAIANTIKNFLKMNAKK